jgi:hypothetical protein
MAKSNSWRNCAQTGPGIVVYPLLWLVMPAGPSGPDHSGFLQRLRKGLTPKHTGS